MLKHIWRNVFLVLLIILPVDSHPSAQKPPGRFGHAVERSRDSARIVSLLALVPDSGLPKELVDKAQAFAVFPRVKSEASLFTTFSQGYGVISSRTLDGWTMPAFYAFGGGGYTKTFLQKNDVHAVVLLFMSDESLGWFEKGGVPLKNERKAVAGPVGTLTEQQRKEIEGAHILAYLYYNGRLDGTPFGKSFWKSFGLNPDNNINKPMYGIKGREVLAREKIPASPIPDGIDAFQQALQTHYATPKPAGEEPKPSSGSE